MSHSPEVLDSRKQILASARTLFSEKGYNGTSIAGIAAEAGVTKSLVMYHWPTKEQLWHDVVSEGLDPYMEVIRRFGENDPSITLEQIVRSTIKMHRENPEITRMWTWMSLDRQLLIQPDKICSGQTAIERAAQEPQSFGLPDGVRPVMVIAMLMAAVDGWFCYRSQLGKITGIDTSTAESEEEFTEALLKLFLPGKA